MHGRDGRDSPAAGPRDAERLDRDDRRWLTLAGFAWAVSVGGDVIYDRFFGITETGVMQTYRENRGLFLEHTLSESLFEYPFGAGLGRWGMMTVYFSEPANWMYPALHAEIQLTGWLYDGGLPLWLFYGGAILLALRHSYRVAVHGTDTLADCAATIFSIQLFIAGLCLHRPRVQHAVRHRVLAAQCSPLRLPADDGNRRVARRSEEQEYADLNEEPSA